MGRRRKKSVSNGFNIEKMIFRFQAPLSTDGSLPGLDILSPTDGGNGDMVSSWMTKVLLIK